TARGYGRCLRILEAVDAVNEEQKHVLFQKLQAALGPDLTGVRVAVWGLAFKPNTDDMRDAPSLAFIAEVLAAGGQVTAHDPVAMDAAKCVLGDTVAFAATSYDALRGADALAVVTDWNEYRHPDFPRIKQTLRRPIVIDARNLYAITKMAELGFAYYSIGRPTVA